METERFGIVFRHYKTENLDFSYTLGINLSTKDISETFDEGYTNYILKLEPDKKFQGQKKGVVLGRGYFDINLLVDQPVSGSIEDLIGEGRPFGRIYFEKKGRGKKARHLWYYQHEAKIPQESESGLALIVGGHPVEIDLPILIEPGRPIELKLRLKRLGEIETTDLVTINVV